MMIRIQRSHSGVAYVQLSQVRFSMDSSMSALSVFRPVMAPMPEGRGRTWRPSTLGRMCVFGSKKKDLQEGESAVSACGQRSKRIVKGRPFLLPGGCADDAKTDSKWYRGVGGRQGRPLSGVLPASPARSAIASARMMRRPPRIGPRKSFVTRADCHLSVAGDSGDAGHTGGRQRRVQADPFINGLSQLRRGPIWSGGCRRCRPRRFRLL